MTKPVNRERVLLGALCAAFLIAGHGNSRAQTIDAAAIQDSATSAQNVNIEADSMEVLEAEKKAIFTGNVSAQERARC